MIGKQLLVNTKSSYLKGKKVLALGMARSGKSVAVALSDVGSIVKVSEIRTDEILRKEAKHLESQGIEVELGRHGKEVLKDIDFIVPSPGMSPKNTILAEAIKLNISIISEVEVASLLTDSPMIGVTGTNGKSTTTDLIGEIIRGSGKTAAVGGNIGLPLTQAVTEMKDSDFVVAELSSFQLEFIRDLKPKVAVLLNISSDHIDWHGGYSNYKEAKYKIFSNQSSNDWAVVNVGLLGSGLPDIRSREIFYGTGKTRKGCYVEKGTIYLNIDNEVLKVGPVGDIRIIGNHNLENTLAAISACYVVGIDIEEIMAAIREYRGIEHRLEFVRDLDGVRFYNDSKATNPEAAIVGIGSFDSPIILIAGGRNKGSVFDRLAASSKDKVKKAIFLGEVSLELASEFSKVGIDHEIVDSLDEATAAARLAAGKGEIVLLSPACASLDMFDDYEHRGRVFKEIVGDLG